MVDTKRDLKSEARLKPADENAVITEMAPPKSRTPRRAGVAKRADVQGETDGQGEAQTAGKGLASSSTPDEIQIDTTASTAAPGIKARQGAENPIPEWQIPRHRPHPARKGQPKAIADKHHHLTPTPSAAVRQPSTTPTTTQRRPKDSPSDPMLTKLTNKPRRRSTTTGPYHKASMMTRDNASPLAQYETTKDIEKRQELIAHFKRLIDDGERVLQRAQSVLADPNLTGPSVQPEVIRNGRRQLENWRRLCMCDVNGREMPVMPPKEMKARILFYLGNRALAPNKTERRYLDVLDAAEQAGWSTIGMPELTSAKKSTYYTGRAHLIREARFCLQHCVTVLKAINFSDRIAAMTLNISLPKSVLEDIERDYQRWTANIKYIKDSLSVLDRYPPDSRGLQFHDQSTWRTGLWQEVSRMLKEHKIRPPKKSTSKKSMLTKANKIDKDWREKFWDEGKTRDYADVIAVMLVSGARPSELCRGPKRSGITVTLDEHDHLFISITSSKVTVSPGDLRRDKGQPVRHLVFMVDSAPAEYLAELVRQNDNQPINVHYPTNSPRPARALSVAIERLAAKVLDLKPNERLTAYVLRHAVSSDIKASLLESISDERNELAQQRQEKRRRELEEGIRSPPRNRETVDEITRPAVLEEASIALGHVGNRTQAAYGSAPQSKSRGTTMLKAMGTRPVRGGQGPSLVPKLKVPVR